MAPTRFRAVIRIRGVNPYVLVSAARARAIKPGRRQPIPVLLRVDGQPTTPWRTNMMPAGDGTFFLYLHGPARKTSRTKVGDRVQIEVAFDARYRNGPQHPMPAWFAAALRQAPVARKNWDALIPSRKKEILRYLSWLKSPEARARNVERALAVLSGRKARFMARAWEKGR